jgi:hypothetical protein
VRAKIGAARARRTPRRPRLPQSGRFADLLLAAALWIVCLGAAHGG